MSIREDEDRERLDAAMRRFYATHRRSLRWWKHAREYVSLLRLLKNGLLKEHVWREPGKDTDYRMVVDPATPAKDGLPSRPKMHGVFPPDFELSKEEQDKVDAWVRSGPVLPSHPPWDARGWRWNTPDGKAPFRY